MYCIHCGANGAHKFCAKCGAAQTVGEMQDQAIDSPGSTNYESSDIIVAEILWTDTLQYDIVLRQPEARARIAACK